MFMLKTIIVGGLAFSIICFLLAQNTRTRNRTNTNGYSSAKYGPPTPDNSPNNDTPITTTEPFFRIVLSKKARANATTMKSKSSTSTSTTESSEDYNDTYNDNKDDDDYKENSQNLTLLPYLNDTTIRRLINVSRIRNMTASTKSNFETTMISTRNPVTSVIHKNLQTFAPTTSPTPSFQALSTFSPRAVSKIANQYTTIKFSPTVTSPKSTIASKQKKIYDFQSVTESQIDAQHGLISTSKKVPLSTTILYENISEAESTHVESLTESTGIVMDVDLPLQMSSKSGKSRTESVTESFDQWNKFIVKPNISNADLRYLPSSPSASLAVPQSTSKNQSDPIDANYKPNSNGSNFLKPPGGKLERNVTQPSRLYRAPTQN